MVSAAHHRVALQEEPGGHETHRVGRTASPCTAYPGASGSSRGRRCWCRCPGCSAAPARGGTACRTSPCRPRRRLGAGSCTSARGSAAGAGPSAGGSGSASGCSSLACASSRAPTARRARRSGPLRRPARVLHLGAGEASVGAVDVRGAPAALRGRRRGSRRRPSPDRRSPGHQHARSQDDRGTRGQQQPRELRVRHHPENPRSRHAIGQSTWRGRRRGHFGG
jgi:hypothetical protein